MGIEDLAIELESSYEGDLLGEITTKKEREESRKSFIEGLKKAVENGGRVIIESSCGVNRFYFKENNKPIRWCISENDAIKYCEYKK